MSTKFLTLLQMKIREAKSQKYLSAQRYKHQQD